MAGVMPAVNAAEQDGPPVGRRGVFGSGWFRLGEPHAVRGPFVRWPGAADGALAVLVFVGSLITVTVSALDDDAALTFESVTDRPAGAVVLLAGAAGALLWRRGAPIAVTAAVMTVMITWAIAGYGDGQDLAVIVAVYAVGRYTTDLRHSLVAVGAVMALSILGTIIDTNQRVDVVPAVVLAWVPWYVGRRVRNRGDYLALLQERAERLEADQNARARQAVADERSRIARELHDVVAHQVSMMTVQAGAAKTIARDDPEAAIHAMGDVEHAGRQALGDLRQLLGVLRPDDAAPGELGPQPGIADIAALAEELAGTGADVALRLGVLPGNLPASVELAVYRIIQESLTNVVKHAGPSPAVAVVVEDDDGFVAVEIDNTIDATAALGLPRSGYGIAGMRERAGILGGWLSAEAVPPDRFRVRARIPLRPETR